MPHEPGKESAASGQSPKDRTREGEDESGGTLNTIPELVRRIVAAGLSGFFLTEEAIRKALGDTLPRDWSEFAVEQSRRTRAELMERLSLEIGRTLENIDVVEVLSDLLSGRTLEVSAEIRLRPNEEDGRSRAKVVARRR